MAKTTSKNFFRDMVAAVKDPDTTLAVDAKGSAEFEGFVDTGCLALNGLLSGTIFGGAADNKVTVFAGESAVGKTYFVMGIGGHFLESDPEAGMVYYDTESAITTKMMRDRGMDVERIIRSEPISIQAWRTNVIQMLEAYIAQGSDKPKFMMILDSLGMLSSVKELEDTGKGNDTRDMTKAGLLRGAFRVCRLKLAKAKVPMLVTNHVYAGIGPYATQRNMSGGGGLKYASDSICFLSKKQDRVGTAVVGNLITAFMFKSRMSRENQSVTLKLNYDRGLDKYYGLLDIAEAGGVIKKKGPKYILPAGGATVYGKEINDHPEQVYNQEILLAIDEFAKQKFQYGSNLEEYEIREEENEKKLKIDVDDEEHFDAEEK